MDTSRDCFHCATTGTLLIPSCMGVCSCADECGQLAGSRTSALSCLGCLTKYCRLGRLHSSGGWKSLKMWFLPRSFSSACRQPPSFHILTWPLLCVCVPDTLVSSSPLLIRTSVSLDQGPLSGPHFNFITSLKLHLQTESCTEMLGVRVSVYERQWQSSSLAQPVKDLVLSLQCRG